MIAARRGDQANLVIRIFIEDQRSKAAQSGGLRVDGLLDGCFEAEIGAVAGEAGVVSEAFGVISETDLVVGVVEAAVTRNQFGFTVPLESRARDYIENAVSAIAVLGGIAAALDLDAVDVLGIELRADVGCNAGVRNGHAVEHPGNLVSAANVQLVVNYVGSRDIVGDHCHAVGLSGAWSVRYLTAGHNAGGSGGVGIDAGLCIVHFNGFFIRGDGERYMQARFGRRSNGDRDDLGFESFGFDLNLVLAKRNIVETEAAFLVAGRGGSPGRALGGERDSGILNRAVLRVVD